MDKIKILLAEDHVLVRQGTQELLEQEEDAGSLYKTRSEQPTIASPVLGEQ